MNSLADMLGGAIDPAALQQHLASGGTINITINTGSKGRDKEDDAESGMEEPEDMPTAEMPASDDMGGPQEPGMLGAVRRAMSAPPKGPSAGVGKGPAHPQTKPGSAKLPSKMPKPAPKKPGIPDKKGAGK